MMTQQNTLLANSWKHHYDDHPSKQLSNSKLTDIKDILAHAKTPEECVATFANSPDLFGLSVSPNRREICLLHNSSVLCGTRIDPIILWAALLGTTANATAIEIDQEDSLAPVVFRCPAFEKLFNACSDAASFSQLELEEADTEVSLRSMICLPPLLTEAEMHSCGKSAADLAVAFAAAMANHDNLMEDDCSDDMALTTLQHALQFCWASAQNKVPPVRYSVASSPAITAWSKALHTSPIMPVSVSVQGAGATAPSNSTLQDITLTMVSQNENMAAQNMLSA
jgi:hypothetical protein